ncbi:hypothetical protein [Aureimonas leprariae]|uniref:Uncharacterized protein n=1 Tax=Plantimonas leprariae TaxID=2615207 RepID=A0A7V7PK64_9HYPH|nr:hypothetical protein [Aureimonas leprariae]KAB0676023.1 hypothetical protein F6X38_22440 [Aureimonas leprariae]
MRKGLAIRVRCPCGVDRLHLAHDLYGYIAPGGEVEELRWRCLSCGERATYVRWVLVQDINRHLVEPWAPPAGTRRWY